MTFKTKTTFKRLAENHTGHIVFQHYGKNNEKILVFSPITPVPSNIECSECRTKQWNATNFSNLIHFCPHRELDVEITDYKSVFVGRK